MESGFQKSAQRYEKILIYANFQCKKWKYLLRWEMNRDTILGNGRRWNINQDIISGNGRRWDGDEMGNGGMAMKWAMVGWR